MAHILFGDRDERISRTIYQLAFQKVQQFGGKCYITFDSLNRCFLNMPWDRLNPDEVIWYKVDQNGMIEVVRGETRYSDEVES